MKVHGVADVAAELDVDPRALRRFLRSDPSYRNAGMGGRYIFSDAEKDSLKRAYTASLKSRPDGGKRPVASPADDHFLDDDPGVPVEKLHRKGLTPSLRAQRQAARSLRQQRLTQRMAAVLVPRYDDETVD